MALRFYNTLTRSLEEFHPLEPGRVGIYACGPTVYQLPHIGNYRTFIFYDVLHRYLEWKGFDVRFITNLTDVDDRIIERSLAAGLSIDEFTAPFIRGFFEDLDALGIRRADAYPRATGHIPEMIRLVERLLERGHAYVADGDVYFDISSFPDYGKLSRIDLSAVRQGERVASDRYEKEDVRDFALWKAAKEVDRRVGAAWPAPWGEGRPGWHLECSAMSMAELGETFDIHAGGEDLIFPHHEDEIAQSEGATGKPFARYWLHSRFLLMDAEKMSKSLGNVVTLRTLLEQGFEPATIRFQLLSAHYRKELDFSLEGLAESRAAVRRLTDFQDRLATATVHADAPASPLPAIAADALAEFERGLDDDLNVPAGLAALFTFVRRTNAALDEVPSASPADLDVARSALARMDDVLGILAIARGPALDAEFVAWVEGRLAAREEARARREFAVADAIRAELARAGVVVEDTPRGPRWKPK
jgi:cysteinyl-tRNA synthetase